MADCTVWLKELLGGKGKNSHEYELEALDRQYVRGWERQSRSKDREEAKIARQGLALRRWSMKAQKPQDLGTQDRKPLAGSACSSSTDSLITILDGECPDALSPRHGKALERCETSATEPEQDKDIKELFNTLQKRQATLDGRLSSISYHEDFMERLLPGFGIDFDSRTSSRSASCDRRGFVPSRIPPPPQREMNNVDLQLRVWGKAYWFCAKQQHGLEANTYHEAPVAVQRRLIKTALEPNLILHFPNWEPFKMAGRGNYRVATELPDHQITKNLVKCMGPNADIIGGFGKDLKIEEHEDLDYHSLLCNKYGKPWDKRLQPPRTEIIDGVTVTQGFPMDFQKKFKIAEEIFLAPMTYEAFDFVEPHGRISDYRLVQYHFWNGDTKSEDPDPYTLADTYPDHKPYHDWANLPYHVKFTNPSKPSHILRPARHSRLQGSDLEALEARDEPPMPTEAQLAQSRGILNARPRPPLSRKVTDKTKKVRAATGLVGILNKRRESTEKQTIDNKEAVEEVGQPMRAGEPCTQPAAIEPVPPLDRSRIAHQRHHAPSLAKSPVVHPRHRADQAEGQVCALPRRPSLLRTKSKVNLPANMRKTKKKVLVPNTKGGNEHDAPPVTKMTETKEDTVPIQPDPVDSILEDNNQEPLEEYWSTQANTPQEECSPRPREEDWSTQANTPQENSSPRSQSIPIPTHSPSHPVRISQPHWTNHLNSVSPKPPPSMKHAIQKIEAKRRSGVTFSSTPTCATASRRGVSAVAEMAGLMTREKEMRMADSGHGSVLGNHDEG